MVLREGLSRASSEDKHVFLTFSAPWCGWCHKLADWMAKPEIGSILDRDLVIVKVDIDRMTHGKDVMAKVRPNVAGGIPWFVVLDSKGKSLGNSDGPQGNIGYPFKPEEIDHFMTVISGQSRHIEAGQLERLKQSLKGIAAAEHRGNSRKPRQGCASQLLLPAPGWPRRVDLTSSAGSLPEYSTRTGTTMPGPIRCFSALLAIFLLCDSARAQTPAANPPVAVKRRPFAKPGTPRREERIRYFDVQHVKAELTLATRQKEVRGTVTHTLSPLHPFLTKVELDCAPELKVAKVTKRAKGEGPVSCSFTTSGAKLTVSLDKAHGPGESLDLAIDYSGSPTAGLRFVLTEPAYPEKPLAIWTQGQAEDTHHWLPCYDYPNERATSEMIVTVEQPLFVVSNGELVETRKNAGGTTTYHWKMDVPHVSYLISLAVGDFAVYQDKVGDLPVDYYVARNVDEKTARRFMGKTPRMIRFFAESTGQPYPYTKYAQTCLPDFGGGMENISATSMTDGALRDEIAALEGDADGLVAHELAHQWFGDLLTCKDWSHIWLNEGFASYFDPLFTEHERGIDAFKIEMEGALNGYLSNDRSYRRPIVETRYDSSLAMFDGMTYAKGACVLHALRGVLGDELWWKGIRGYVAAHKYKVVETDDFRKAMEAASEKDLKWFFDQWLKQAGHQSSRGAAAL